jgi:fumarate hydratase class II
MEPVKPKPSRAEYDSLGEIDVPDSCLWGAQTQRSLKYFAIGSEAFPPGFIHSLCQIKKAAAKVNNELELLDSEKSALIQQACDQVLSGQHNDQFPLRVWQTGSGTQTNMNVNEVVANIANRYAGSALGSKTPIHPNDHVNLSQSSNDVFPTAMHLFVRRLMTNELLPALAELKHQLQLKSAAFADKVKVGRTHMMDATAVSLGQEFAGFCQQIEFAMARLNESCEHLESLPIGGTAVGNGFGRHKNWPERMCEELSATTGMPATPSKNPLWETASHDALANCHGQLAGLATALFKISSDLRLMNSGPRCGLSEISIPANEPGSSMMPGKVNPTQIEAMTMVCLRVLGNQTSVTMANSQGQFQLNTYKPLFIHLLTESITLLADSCRSFTNYCVAGIEANLTTLARQQEESLMYATALSAALGYEKTAEVVQYASKNKLKLREAVIALELMSTEEFDSVLEHSNLTGPFE